MPPQKPRRVKRGRPSRSDQPRILILCEGTRTEPNYFGGFKKAQRLTSVVVRPLRSGQVGPAGLLRRVREELKEDSGWDEVYCILDHDGRDAEIDSFEKKLAAVDLQTDSCDIKMVLSRPCFEFWLLLHFEITDRPFSSGPRGTECEDVIKRLGRHLHGYEKNDSQVFEKCREHIHAALENAERLRRTVRSLPRSPSAPQTQVETLVRRLLKLSQGW